MMQPGSSMQHPQQNRAPLQRAAVQRHHARRSANIITNTFNMDNTAMSPQAGPTPSSHTSSPSNVSVRSPITMQTGRMTPPTSAHSQSTQQFPGGRSQPLISMLPNEPMNPPSRLVQTNPYAARPGSAHHQQMTTGNATNRSTSSTSIQGVQAQKPADSGMASQNPSNYYPSPFQKHIDQLEQEYDTQDASQSMLDQLEPDPSDHDNMHANYSSQIGLPHVSYAYHQQLTPHSQNEQNHMSPTAQLPTDMIDPNDPLLDADPFGLTASMHYPTAYSFDHQARR
ncbi:hypothetical protein AMS68_000970 [Peltaster fructicola]|uniref:Uncharacterized protein n=1 Tax=Peltaster fructicola TaxID=286661 RepID=A0A6H0XL58_9PEZI|nr:hypothetical protein AMS68_000970 [Peltaster fructicola]